MKNIESKIRSYGRSFPVKFIKALDSSLFDENSKEYIDFFTGAGTMNYGHNNHDVNQAMIEYINSNIIIHSLDLQTKAKNIKRKGKIMHRTLSNFAKKNKKIIDVRGIGLIYGIELPSNEIALKIRNKCFKNGLIVELVRGDDNTVKLLPPLTISDQDLEKGLEILLNSLERTLSEK